MIKAFLFSLFILTIGFSSCKKDPIAIWEVQYKVINLGNDIPTYRIKYKLQNESTKSVGPFNTYDWKSETLTKFEENAPVWMEIEIISGKGELQLQILRDNAIHEQGNMPLGISKYSIESTL
jgi:hypothetical protein